MSPRNAILIGDALTRLRELTRGCPGRRGTSWWRPGGF